MLEQQGETDVEKIARRNRDSAAACEKIGACPVVLAKSKGATRMLAVPDCLGPNFWYV